MGWSSEVSSFVQGVMDFPLGSVTALIFCRSGGGSLVACSVDLITSNCRLFSLTCAKTMTVLDFCGEN